MKQAVKRNWLRLSLSNLLNLQYAHIEASGNRRVVGGFNAHGNPFPGVERINYGISP
jgi:hypothetical protein